MQGLPAFADPNLLLGAEHFGDAGVYRLADRLAIVQSVDFFPPIVNDPYLFGRIAAANALSDIYAIGAQPRTALNIVGFPDEQVDLEVLGEILRGGAERIEAAGAVVVGGHSLRDAEIKYGLAVTGVVDPELMMTNMAAKPGQVLVLTKPLGTGFITTAAQAGKCPDDVLAGASASMVRLNRAASEAAVALGAKAATDITGFGLGVHAGQMARASGVTFVMKLADLPLLPGAKELASKGHHTRANATNRDHVKGFTLFEAAADSLEAQLLFDPQTSGGLLVAMPPRRAEEFVQRCRADAPASAAIIGSVESSRDVDLVIR